MKISAVLVLLPAMGAAFAPMSRSLGAVVVSVLLNGVMRRDFLNWR